MKQNLHQIFKSIRTTEPSSKLADLIMIRIEVLREKQTKRKLILSYFSLVSSFSAFIFTIIAYGNAFLQSDFWILLRLLATDASSVLKNWNDFAFSLLETFPAVSAAIMLVPVFAILLSFSAYFKLINQRHYNYI
jgi:hypothetical protein